MRKDIRRLELLQFEANAPRSIPLPRDRLIKAINLKFSASAVVAGGAADGTVVEDAPLMLMPRIEIVGNGHIVLFRMDAQALYFKNEFEYGTPALITPPTAGAEATYEIDVLLQIDFKNKIGMKPCDTFLNAAAFKTLTLNVQWGDPDAMFEGTYDRTCTISAAYGITPIVYETTEPQTPFVRIQDMQEKEITATSDSFWMDLDAGTNRIIQAVMFKTLDTGCRESDIINYISLATDAKYRHIDMLPFVQLQNENKIESGLEAINAGLAYLYMLEEGHTRSGLHLLRTNKARFVMDVTVGAGTTMVRLYTDHVQPL